MSKSKETDEKTQLFMQQIQSLLQGAQEDQGGTTEATDTENLTKDTGDSIIEDVTDDSCKGIKCLPTDDNIITSGLSEIGNKVEKSDSSTGSKRLLSPSSPPDSPLSKIQKTGDFVVKPSISQLKSIESDENSKSKEVTEVAEHSTNICDVSTEIKTICEKSFNVSEVLPLQAVDDQDVAEAPFPMEIAESNTNTVLHNDTIDPNREQLVSACTSQNTELDQDALIKKCFVDQSVKKVDESVDIAESQQTCSDNTHINSIVSDDHSTVNKNTDIQYDISDSQQDVSGESSIHLLKDEHPNTEIFSNSEATKVHSFFRSPVHITSATSTFDKPTENYLRGCKWSPDGSCVLTNSNDNCLRLFNLPESIYKQDFSPQPEITAVLRIQESDLVYDYCWFPKMSSLDPASCCFVTSCREQPVHMWDAFTGCLRCTYRPYNHVDEIAAAHSLAFSLDGDKLYCGFNKIIRIFDVNSPGRECTQRPTFEKKSGQSGIISCISASPQGGGLYAAGSYSKSIALYYEPKGGMVCMFQGQIGGVTHIMFSPDGTKLFSGGRKDPEILCWDLRNPGQILFTAVRKVATNQRVYFDTDYSGKYLVSGNQDGTVTVWDTTQQPVKDDTDSDPIQQPILSYKAHNDMVNGISVHPSMPLLATASGQRHFPELGDSSDSETDDITDVSDNIDYSLKLWWTGQK